jgi:hypothetical protein
LAISSKIRKAMQGAILVSIVTGALFFGATIAHAAEPAAAAVSSSTSASDPVQSDDAGVMGQGDCRAWLQVKGYPVTNTRAKACFVAAQPIGNQGARIGICIGVMVSTGVSGRVSSVACTLATGP